MKDFLKFTLATVTGIILSSIVLFIISMVTLFGIHDQLMASNHIYQEVYKSQQEGATIDG